MLPAGLTTDAQLLRAAAQAILKVVDDDEPPLDLLLGSDALQRARTRLDRFDEDVRRWEDVSLATDFSA